MFFRQGISSSFALGTRPVLYFNLLIFKLNQNEKH